MLGCATNRDMLLLATLRYVSSSPDIMEVLGCHLKIFEVTKQYCNGHFNLSFFYSQEWPARKKSELSDMSLISYVG